MSPPGLVISRCRETVVPHVYLSFFMPSSFTDSRPVPSRRPSPGDVSWRASTGTAFEAEEPYRTIYTLLALSGLRLGEALGLAWRHINFTGDFIQVERTWTFLGCFQSPKTPASRRAVPMLPTLSRVLRERYEELGSPKPDTLLFSYDGSQPVDQSNVRKDFLATLQRLGLRRVTPHSLRHSFASVMVASGASIKALQRCLGHSSASVTLNTYSHLIQENLGPALLRADELLGINDLGTTEQF